MHLAAPGRSGRIVHWVPGITSPTSALSSPQPRSDASVVHTNQKSSRPRLLHRGASRFSGHAGSCRGGVADAIGHVTGALPLMVNFVTIRRAQAEVSDRALPRIPSAGDRTGEWSAPDTGSLLLRAYDKLVKIGYRQNRLIVRVTREDIQFEQQIAAKTRAAVETLRAECDEAR